MQYTLALVALAAGLASAQGVTSVLTPTASAPAGCSTDFAGNFEITVVLPPTGNTKRDVESLEKRQSTSCASDGTLVASLKGGILTDAKGRIGSIVANNQFQFDGPPAQAGAIFTGGWSVCNNGSLAIGGSALFFQCLSGTFYNLYDKSQGGQCQPVLIDIIPCTTGGGSGSASGAGQGGDGQPTAASATVVTQKTDGQPNAASATKAATQIADGQIQASSAVPKPVSQFTDGQIQVTASPVPAPAPVSQISDGQIQATTAIVKPVSQISDGQVQATKATTAPAAPVSQISDGQVQATSAATLKTTASPAGAPVSQISDGQVQATAASNVTKTSAAPSVFTGAAPSMHAVPQMVAGAAAAVAFAML